jgi:hypothetical protein
MQQIRPTVVAFALAFALLPAVGGAQGFAGRWSLGFQGGTDLELGGKLHEAGSGTVLGLATSVESRSFSDIYDPGFRGQLEIGYGVGAASVGTVAGLALNGDFADYEEWGAELGIRRYFRADKPFKLYVAGVAGLRFVSELPATFSVPAAGVVLADVPFYESSTVFMLGADLGFSYDLSDQIALGLETGPRYQTGLGELEGLAGTGLEPINDTGSRWSMPFLATLRLRF